MESVVHNMVGRVYQQECTKMVGSQYGWSLWFTIWLEESISKSVPRWLEEQECIVKTIVEEKIT